MNKQSNREMNERARKFIVDHPGCSHTELIKGIHYPALSKGYFFNMKTDLRKKGLLPKSGEKTNSGRASHSAIQKTNPPVGKKSIQIEILDSVDVAGFSQDIRDHYKSHVLPLLQRLMPQGKNLNMVFLSDPPSLEIRRTLP